MTIIRRPHGWFAAVLLAALVAPGLRAAGPNDCKKSATSLKTLAYAMHAYADAHRGDMPPAAVHGKDGKPLYSWRVLILPYLGENKLFAEFHKDEAWDSPHNKNLLARMPRIFSPLGGEAGKNHKTYYQLFVGPGTAFTGKNRGPRMPASFLDGTSNTFLIVEADKPVPWTSPQDVAYSPKKPLPKVGGLFKDGFHAVMADGFVMFFKKGQLSESTFRHAVSPDGGEVMGRDFANAKCTGK